MCSLSWEHVRNKWLTSLFNVKITESAEQIQQQNLMFSDATSDWDYTVPSSPDPTFGTADMSDASLATFFSRPIKILSITDAPGSAIHQTFDPWSLYFDNPRVVNRVCNFNLMRAKLCVKFVINGNGFYFGRYLVSYVPLAPIDQFSVNRAGVASDVVEASQRPHLYIDPCTSQGGTICLPFVWPYNALSIPLTEWNLMGDLNIRSMATLQHANAATTPLTISVFAWAEDVQLSIPTSQEPITLVPQSGSEYTTGPISTPAGVVARVAASLSQIPLLRPYALATEMVADTVSAVAKMFGFSRPVVISEIQSMRPTFGNYANTNVPDNCHKLTLDTKQEVAVDSRVVGLAGHDEMAIRSIATRESYLTNFFWNSADPSEKQLFSVRVTPALWATSGAAPEYHLTAMAFASLPFKYWRGSIRYRFQVVSSAFHKGRLKIVYDPVYPTGTEYNVNYVRIIDISTEKDFSLTIGWGSDKPFLLHRNPGDVYVPFSDIVPLAGSEPLHSNGILSVYVVNELTVPNSAAVQLIQTNVFASAGDDFEVVEPIDCFIKNYSWIPPPAPGFAAIKEEPERTELEPQSGTMVMEGDTTVDVDSKPISDEDQLMSTKVHGTADIYKVVFADPIGSARQVIKRYSLFSLLVGALGGATQISIRRYFLPDFPYYRGTFAGGAVNAAGLKNYCRMTFLNWFTPAYVCRRGGLRWKYVRFNGQENGQSGSYLGVKREPCTVSYSFADTFVSTATLDAAQQFVSSFPGSIDGAQINPSQVNPVVEVDLPYYTNRRFWPGKDFNMLLNASQNTNFHSLTVGNSTGNAAAMASYVSGSDDFDLSFFTGAPILYNIGTL